MNKTYNLFNEKLNFIGIVDSSKQYNISHMLAHMLEKNGGAIEIKNTLDFFHEKDAIGPKIIEEYGMYLQQQIDKGTEVVILQVTLEFMENYHLFMTPFDIILYAVSDNQFSEEDYVERNNTIEMGKTLLRYLPQESIIIMNTDEPLDREVLNDLKNRFVITYGLSSRATVTASSIETSPHVRFYSCIQRGITTKQGTEIEPMEFPVQSNPAERNDVYSMLAAESAALILGVTPENIVKGFSDFTGPYKNSK